MPRNPDTSQQINILDDGHILPGNYPDPVEQSSIDTERRWRDRNDEKEKADFQRIVDTSELNDTYAEPLAEAKEYFAREGIEIAPLRVINRETYDELVAQQIGYVEAEGLLVYNRAVVVENKRAVELFGNDFVLNIALHEAAHSIGNIEDERVIYITTPESIGRIAVHEGNMHKIDLRNESNGFKGYFWEEAFADLTRVRALRELGRTHDIKEADLYKGKDKSDIEIWCVPNNSNGNNHTGIALPGEFTSSSKSSPDTLWAISAPNFAAYTLDLLDQHTPGLYEDLKAARTNPPRQRDAIQKIESVRPGLYRELRELQYSEKDFIQGLATTLKALELPPYNTDY